jgi:hypothetical protein
MTPKAALAPLALFALGCCDDDVVGASTSLLPDVSLGSYLLWVGDAAPVYSSALSNPGTGPIWCDGVVYSSQEQPRLFQYNTTDPTVGIIDERRRFVAHAVGRTGIVTSTAGVSDTTFVIVGPAITSLRVSVTPLPARAGDTVAVTLDALDGAGAAISGAEVTLLWIENASDSLATWIRTVRAERPFPSITFQAPLTDRLVLHRPGTLRIVAIAPHDTGQPPRYVADTLTLSITQ